MGEWVSVSVCVCVSNISIDVKLVREFAVEAP